MTRSSRTAVERQLAVAADVGEFTEAELEGCDEPVARYFRAAIATGTPLVRAAIVRMRGSIKFGRRWVSFQADELLAPLHGYLWPATVAGGLLRGSDSYADGAASMTWKLLGLVRVIRTSGPDVARSAMGRVVAESVWLPTGLLPRYGVGWRAENDHHLVAEVPIQGNDVSLQITIDDGGLVHSVHLDRWSDTNRTGHFERCPFGIDVAASRTFSCGITMPAEGAGGWFHGADRWSEGEFFRYRILDLAPVGPAPTPTADTP